MKKKRGYPLDKKHVPPFGKRFLLLRGANETGGGVLCVAHIYTEQGQDLQNTEIYYVGGSNGWKILRAEEYKNCRWMPSPFDEEE